MALSRNSPVRGADRLEARALWIRSAAADVRCITRRAGGLLSAEPIVIRYGPFAARVGSWRADAVATINSTPLSTGRGGRHAHLPAAARQGDGRLHRPKE